ncbi:MAG TPA: BrxA/BrxB family bacilliredoxin [Gemmatimonadales bacterium]
MPYQELMVRPMREELTQLGVKELKTLAEVDAVLANPTGTQLVFVNSVCGCAAGGARPALALALGSAPVKPEQLYTVFAGQDLEATARARSYFADYEPSSPSIALLKDGEVVHFVHRHMIEGRHPQQLAADLVAAFQKHCGEAMSRPSSTVS